MSTDYKANFQVARYMNVNGMVLSYHNIIKVNV